MPIQMQILAAQMDLDKALRTNNSQAITQARKRLYKLATR